MTAGRQRPLAPRPLTTDKATMIDSREKLEVWLDGSSSENAQAISARSVLRALPYALVKRMFDDILAEYSVTLFRAIIVPWIALNFPPLETTNSALSARKAIDNDLMNSGDTIVFAVAQAAKVANLSNKPSGVKAAHANRILADITVIARSAFWNNISADCDFLDGPTSHITAAELLTGELLWPRGAPPLWHDRWKDAAARLLELDPTYQVWIDWYNRRIEGHDEAFDLPGDTDRIEDKKILARLADATNEDFWDKGATYVNTTLQRWIEEARARVAPPPPSQLTKPLPLNGLLSDPQDSHSPVFGNDPNGQIAINRHAGAEQMRTDAQAQTRHGLARRMAKALHDGLFGYNGVEKITGLAKDYLAGFGEQVEQSNPAILILFGDLIRSEIAKHRSAGLDDVLQALPSKADSDATAFLSAHNMFVGSDAYLDALDRTLRGPDVRLPVVSSNEIKAIADEIYADGILAEPTHDYMVKAADAAPADFNPDNRHSRFVAGLAQNFARYTVEIIATYPKELAGIAATTGIGAVATFGVTTTITAIAAVAGGVTAIVTVAYKLARNIIANEDKYRRWLGTSPAGKHNIERIIAFVKSLPFKSLKDD